MEFTGSLSARSAARIDWLKRAPNQARGALWAARNPVTCAGSPSIGRRHKFPLVDNRGGRIEFGRGVRLMGFRFPASFGVGPGGVLRVGDNSGFNQGVDIFASTSIEIGSWTSIGNLVSIFDTSFHEVEPGAGVVTKPVVIGDNVMVGPMSIILPGVTIGDNTVVGAGSLVTSSLPAGVLAAGNPATVKRTLKIEDGWIRLLGQPEPQPETA